VKDWNFASPVPTLMAFTQQEQSDGGLTLYQASSMEPRRRQLDRILAYAGGVHGSSALRQDKNPRSARFYWNGVKAFLKAVLK
jgi:hypothetical protein